MFAEKIPCNAIASDDLAPRLPGTAGVTTPPTFGAAGVLESQLDAEDRLLFLHCFEDVPALLLSSLWP